MTLILKLGLDMVKMYQHTKNEVSMLRGSKVIAWIDRNTDRQTHTDTQTHRHDRKHYLPAYVGGNNSSLPLSLSLCSMYSTKGNIDRSDPSFPGPCPCPGPVQCVLVMRLHCITRPTLPDMFNITHELLESGRLAIDWYTFLFLF